MTYTPMPQQLDHLLQKLVKEASDPQASASNTVFVFREVLGQAYAMGHREGHTQASSQRWLVDELDEALKKRRAAGRQEPPVTPDEGDNFDA